MKSIAGLMVVMMLFFSGCMQSVRLNARSLVQAVGVDLAEEGGYRITVQLSQADRQAADSKEKTQFIVVQETGSTMTEALTKAAVANGKQMFLGNCKLLVLGEEAAGSGAAYILNFFNSNHQINPTMSVAVVRGKAGDLLSDKEDPMRTADGIVEMIKAASKTGYAVQSRMMDLVGSVHSENMAGAIAAIALVPVKTENASSSTSEEEANAQTAAQPDQPETPQPKEQLRLAGTAVFQKDRLIGYLNPQATRGLAWLENHIVSTSLVVQDKRLGRIAAVTNKQKAKITPELRGDLMVFEIDVQVRSTAMETMLESGSHFTDEQKKHAVSLQERQITTEIEGALQAAQKQGFDLLGLSLLLKQRHPSYYETHKDNWAESLAEFGYNVKVTCEIDRSGVGKIE